MLIIGITGTLGAGKGTIVEYIVKNKGFKHYSVSDFLTNELKKQKRTVNRDNMREIANEIRTKFGPSYIIRKLFDKAKKQKSGVIIESIRNPKEAEFIKASGGYLFAVDASIKTRYLRISSRGSSKDSITFDEFKTQEEKEKNSTDPNAQNLSKCMEMADYTFKNNSTIKNLNKKVEGVIRKLKTKMTEKYKRPSWDEYFLEISNAVSKRSTCDRGRASCVFVKDKQILATGYAGSPKGFPHCDDVGHDLRKSLNDDGIISEHCVRTVHAEQNAICQAAKRGISIEGATVYVSMTPCRICTMLLINSGIQRVVANKKYPTGAESEKMLKRAKIKLSYIHRSIEKYPNQQN